MPLKPSVVIAALAMLACDPFKPMCACPPARSPESHAIVNGVLQREDGGLVSDAVIRVEGALLPQSPCDFSQTFVFSPDSVRVSNGSFSVRVFTEGAAPRYCVL